ncbi:MAG: hypothetical protein OMOMHJEC_02691 [Xanthomonadales bacterium]|nr:hypothetical protein [Xanthomonadales bacterium]
MARNFSVELALKIKSGSSPVCRVARGGFRVGGGRQRAVGGRVPLGASPVGRGAQAWRPACRIVRGGFRMGGGRHRAVGGRVPLVASQVGGAVAVLGQECRVGAAAFVWVGDAAARLRAVAPSAHARGSR